MAAFAQPPASNHENAWPQQQLLPLAPPKSPAPPGSLLVPAEAWHAMEAQLAELRAETSECKRFLRAHLRLEHNKRNSAATRLQAAWRRHSAIAHHPRGRRLARWRTWRRSRLLLTPARLHVSRPPVVLFEAVARRLVPVQALARGFLVRRRAAAFLTQQAAARSLQAMARGRQSRQRNALLVRSARRAARLEARVASLADELERERRARQIHEKALRRLWNAVLGPGAASAAAAAGDAAAGDAAALRAAACSSLERATQPTPPSPAEPAEEGTQEPRETRLRSCERVCVAAAAARRRAAAECVQAAWRARSAGAPEVLVNLTSPTVLRF